MTVRPATAADGPALQAIEVRAGQAFAEVGHPDVAGDDPLPVATLAAYADDGRSAVVVDEVGQVVGYVLVDRVDDAAHVEQVSVDPDHQGQGLSRLLLDWVAEWARTDGRSALSLTTFRDVPWNAPLYAHLGFRALDADEVGPELVALMAVEAAHGLAPDDRVAMRRDL